jgi:transposase, IS30 family
MPKPYTHLSCEERAVIQTKLEMGFTPGAIALGLGRAPSTIKRELDRNQWLAPSCPRKPGRPPLAGGYRTQTAQARARAMASKPRVMPKLIVGNPLWELVIARLACGLSPEQVGSTLARMPQPVRISHETIYTAIYAMPRGELRTEIIGLLRKSHRTRRPRARGEDRRGLIPNMTSIEERPLEVDERVLPGHWEGDLIKGMGNRSQVGTLVERTTLFTVLAKVDRATALCAAESFAKALARIDSQMLRSLTYDQGREMAAHEKFSQDTGMAVYFANPHSPWERGINENTNGLLREYLPKGSDLSVYTQDHLDTIAWTLNVRPRKSLGWKCPAELFLPEGAFDFQAYWSNPPKPVEIQLKGLYIG